MLATSQTTGRKGGGSSLELRLMAHTAGLSPLERLIEPLNLLTRLLEAPRGYGEPREGVPVLQKPRT